MTTNAKMITYRIWIAGGYNDALRAVREFCEEGACFAVHATDYAYTGGLEAGVCVTRINYPRFPATDNEINAQVFRLAEHMRARLFQDSYTVEGPDETTWVTRREDAKL